MMRFRSNEPPVTFGQGGLGYKPRYNQRFITGGMLRKEMGDIVPVGKESLFRKWYMDESRTPEEVEERLKNLDIGNVTVKNEEGKYEDITEQSKDLLDKALFKSILPTLRHVMLHKLYIKLDSSAIKYIDNSKTLEQYQERFMKTMNEVERRERDKIRDETVRRRFKMWTIEERNMINDLRLKHYKIHPMEKKTIRSHIIDRGNPFNDFGEAAGDAFESIVLRTVKSIRIHEFYKEVIDGVVKLSPAFETIRMTGYYNSKELHNKESSPIYHEYYTDGITPLANFYIYDCINDSKTKPELELKNWDTGTFRVNFELNTVKLKGIEEDWPKDYFFIQASKFGYNTPFKPVFSGTGDKSKLRNVIYNDIHKMYKENVDKDLYFIWNLDEGVYAYKVNQTNNTYSIGEHGKFKLEDKFTFIRHNVVFYKLQRDLIFKVDLRTIGGKGL